MEDKIYSLSEDYTFIRENGEKIYRHDSIYDEEIYENLPLCEFLYDPEKSSQFDKEIRKYLRKIVDHSSPTASEPGEIIELLDEHDENDIYGLICLHKIDFIDRKYLVYDRHDWFDFHRYFLGLYPISESHFFHEAKKYFIKLHFHEQIETTLSRLEGGLSVFSKTIVRSLSGLNDIFPEYYASESVNLPEILRAFSSRTSTQITMEGNIKRKSALTFEFEYETDEAFTEKICCEPHIKLERSDNPGDSKYYFNRIYFHPGRSYIHGGKILVCHIGCHL